jgi:YVTN family beta-propeller protein
VSNHGSNTVSAIDTATNLVFATIPVGGSPTWLALTPAGDFAYVTNYTSNAVSVIRTATNTVVAIVPGFAGPWGIGITPDCAPLTVAFDGALLDTPPTPTRIDRRSIPIPNGEIR